MNSPKHRGTRPRATGSKATTVSHRTRRQSVEPRRTSVEGQNNSNDVSAPDPQILVGTIISEFIGQSDSITLSQVKDTRLSIPELIDFLSKYNQKSSRTAVPSNDIDTMISLDSQRVLSPRPANPVYTYKNPDVLFSRDRPPSVNRKENEQQTEKRKTPSSLDYQHTICPKPSKSVCSIDDKKRILKEEAICIHNLAKKYSELKKQEEMFNLHPQGLNGSNPIDIDAIDAGKSEVLSDIDQHLTFYRHFLRLLKKDLCEKVKPSPTVTPNHSETGSFRVISQNTESPRHQFDYEDPSVSAATISILDDRSRLETGVASDRSNPSLEALIVETITDAFSFEAYRIRYRRKRFGASKP